MSKTRRPWESEPDRIEFTAHGFTCLILRNGVGSLCGYVYVPPGHPWHGKDTDDINANIHGGITWSERAMRTDDPPPNDYWCVGFDCAHCGDLCPGMLGYGLSEEKAAYRSVVYVRKECEHLAKQAASADYPDPCARRVKASKQQEVDNG